MMGGRGQTTDPLPSSTDRSPQATVLENVRSAFLTPKHHSPTIVSRSGGPSLQALPGWTQAPRLGTIPTSGPPLGRRPMPGWRNGRRWGLKILCRKASGFESRSRHSAQQGNHRSFPGCILSFPDRCRVGLSRKKGTHPSPPSRPTQNGGRRPPARRTINRRLEEPRTAGRCRFRRLFVGGCKRLSGFQPILCAVAVSESRSSDRQSACPQREGSPKAPSP